MWRSAVNGALRRFTGYQLERSRGESGAGPGAAELRRRLRASEDALGSTREELRSARRRVRTLADRNEKARARARASRRRLTELRRRQQAVPPYYDQVAARILERSRERTMTSQAKLFGLVEATRYLTRHAIPGAIVECGVWRGGSMQAAAWTLLEEGAPDRELHLFDTFEGMPPPTEKDRRPHASAAELLAAHDRDHRVWAVAGLDDVRQGMEETGYPRELVHYHPGLVEDTVPDQAPAQIALLRLDTDWYESTRHELEHLYDRLAPGGVLILDDYGDWEGARQAADEFLADRGEPLLLVPLGSGRLAVKPRP